MTQVADFLVQVGVAVKDFGGDFYAEYASQWASMYYVWGVGALFFAILLSLVVVKLCRLVLAKKLEGDWDSAAGATAAILVIFALCSLVAAICNFGSAQAPLVHLFETLK